LRGNRGWEFVGRALRHLGIVFAKAPDNQFLTGPDGQLASYLIIARQPPVPLRSFSRRCCGIPRGGPDTTKNLLA
jgi:hypothetical protein